jgi:hypothetical protein
MQGGQRSVVLRKAVDCKICPKTLEIDTIEDKFEILPQTNSERFNKLASILTKKVGDQPFSIRLTVAEDGENAFILDYDPFFSEKEFITRYK